MDPPPFAFHAIPRTPTPPPRKIRRPSLPGKQALTWRAISIRVLLPLRPFQALETDPRD